MLHVACMCNRVDALEGLHQNACVCNRVDACEGLHLRHLEHTLVAFALLNLHLEH